MRRDHASTTNLSIADGNGYFLDQRSVYSNLDCCRFSISLGPLSDSCATEEIERRVRIQETRFQVFNAVEDFFAWSKYGRIPVWMMEVGPSR